MKRPGVSSRASVTVFTPRARVRSRRLGGFVPGQNVHSVPVRATYDKQGLQLLNISKGNFLFQGEQVVALVHRENPNGAVEISASRPPESEGVSGHGVVTTLTFQAKTTGRFPVKITKVAVVQPGQQLTAVSASETTVSVQ